ncbi:MAG: sigma 54-interacting transcriptional regulator, partial [Lachnospiraceae bacterium]|nr:sigma 54-interacting transcriptional regulator [Lachnospiraceae bacterium]
NRDIVRDLRLVFEYTVSIKTVYWSQFKPDEPILGDAILIMRPSVKEMIQAQVGDSSQVVVVTRTLTEESVYRLYSIPQGTRVLVVNESPETTMDTVSMLYQLRIEHLKLVPYLNTNEDVSDIHTAVTPGEVQFVPSFIQNIVDLGNRRLDMQTFLDLLDILKLNNDTVKQNLIRYANNVIELHNGVKKRYTDSYLLNGILKQVLNLQENGIIVTDTEFHINYWNNRAERILEAAPVIRESLARYFLPEHIQKMVSANFHEDLFTIKGRQFMVFRNPLQAMRQVTGYIFIFESAVQIRKSGSNLSARLKSSGLTAKYTFEDIFYRSPDMEKCVSVAKRVAQSSYAVLITGETGTGKEMFAQAIHNASPRRNMPFVAVNCAALPESLLESELFGYEEGAFTGARRGGKLGLFELANGGTIFLDEIGDMPYTLQSKLLRVLQEQQIVRLGGKNVINIDVRILTATNCDLQFMIQEKKFREDLFYRLNVFPLKLIPLRQRRQDIVPLFCRMAELSADDISSENQQKLETYSWPGNVRELRNAVEYFSLMGTLDCIQTEESIAGENQLYEPGVSIDELKERITGIVRRRMHEDLRTGRASLLSELHSQGISVSEKRMEHTLSLMRQEGTILRGKGRAGITLQDETR